MSNYRNRPERINLKKSMDIIDLLYKKPIDNLQTNEEVINERNAKAPETDGEQFNELFKNS